MPRILNAPKTIHSTSSDYPILDNDGYELILVTTGSSANVTITLPTAADNKGRRIKIQKVDSGTKFVAVSASENIRGSSSDLMIIQQHESEEFVSDGSNWLLDGKPDRVIRGRVNSVYNTIDTANGTWGTVASIGTGRARITIISGVFINNPVANVTVQVGTGDTNATLEAAPTTTNADISIYDIPTTTRINEGFFITLVGPK